MPETITITLTNRPPVTVRKDAWPIVAEAEHYDTEHRHQANRFWRMKVRQHEDGRAVVYAVFDSAYRGERDKRAGEVVPADADIAAAINRVALSMGWETDPGSVAASCIANLPADELV